jgi:hypothetical protein|tara:strand:+ start:1911 stop:2186 length:276 start_codon:yes stop_codon:yes gene_type:complete
MKERTRKRLEYIEKRKEKYRKYSKERLIEMVLCGDALWNAVENYDVCEDDYRLIDLYESLPDEYAYHDDGFIILKEMWTLTEEDGWIRKED